YQIGSSKHWNGATVFWQIDKNLDIRSGKVMLYDKDGHRAKRNDGNGYITWVHSLLYDDYNLKQCLFGEHLLIDSEKPVALVESEKTAIIASVHYPDYTWLAVGSKHNIKPEVC